LELFGLESNFYSNEPTNKKINFEEMIEYETDLFGKVGPINEQIKNEIKNVEKVID